MGQNGQKTEPPATEKTLLEDKVKLEEQLKETVVRPRGRGLATPAIRPGAPVGSCSK